jgi:putative ATPase
MENIPLAERLRPDKLSGFVGQKELVGKNGIIKNLLDNAKDTGFFPSLIFWGPPGSGKTTLARIIANELERQFYEFSAVNTSSKDVEKVIEESAKMSSGKFKQPELTASKGTSKKKKGRKFTMSAPIVFLDEIHRFNKAQQDKLLPHVEKGTIVLIGATTENPSFEVIGPLLSRTRVLVLEQLTEKELNEIIKNGEKEVKKKLNKNAKDFLIESSNGDARVALTVLEIASQISSTKKVKLTDIEKALQRRQFTFDKKGEEYFNVISAYIKSMRASNVDAALYYLARMVEAGQDPLYIARRMVVFASEDVASPTALVVANAVFRACETVGYPECQENLAAGTLYLTTAKKDRSAYEAFMRAKKDVQKYGNLPVPMKIRNAPTKLMEDLGYGKGYEKYTKESLLPKKLKNKKYYKK